MHLSVVLSFCCGVFKMSFQNRFNVCLKIVSIRFNVFFSKSLQDCLFLLARFLISGRCGWFECGVNCRCVFGADHRSILSMLADW